MQDPTIRWGFAFYRMILSKSGLSYGVSDIKFNIYKSSVCYINIFVETKDGSNAVNFSPTISKVNGKFRF